jgi:ubiquinone/menaquinone biosynthesis C-methylase UbiE
MNEWNAFFREKAKKIFEEKSEIIDIGGTLGIDNGKKSNRIKRENAWLVPYLDRVSYKVLDKVPDYHPDIVGDIHALPMADNSVDAIFCSSVIEHVENPIKAVEEIYRVFKPGGYAYFYAPFIFPYHAEKGYYKDFYRFTYDGWEYLTRQFASREISPVHGPLATVFNLFPLFFNRVEWLHPLDRWLRPHSRQVSGYDVFCIK